MGTYENLAEIVKNSESYADVLRALSLPTNTSLYGRIQKEIAKQKLCCKHFTGQGWMRGKVIGPKRNINDYLENKRFITSHKLKARIIQDRIKPHKCEDCGREDWKNEKIPLELHHLDGNKHNNNLINLQLLCPNCHAMTSNYRGKNMSKSNKIIKQPKVPEEVVVEAIKSSMNVSEVLRKLNLSIFGQNHNRIKEIKNKYQLEFTPKPTAVIAKDQSWRKHDKPNGRKIKNRPTKENLEQLIKERSFVEIGKSYGVSDNAIRKWCTRYGINTKTGKFSHNGPISQREEDVSKTSNCPAS